ncbi:MAG: terminase large subunit [Vicinamibacterales bacterium]
MRTTSPKPRRKNGRPPPAADPVTQYARDVAAGAITAGRPVRLACQRHLADLARAGTPTFPYRFEPTNVAKMLMFFETFLTLDDVDPTTGEHLPFRLVRWLQFTFGSLVGWVHVETGRLRFVEAYLETGKGSTKTPAGAGFALYRLVGLNRTAVENYALGVNADQANYLYQFAKKMVERSEDLNALLDAGEYNTAWAERNSFFRPLTSEGRSLDNKRVFTALIEELHEHPTPVIPEKMRLGIKGQVDALIIHLTNAGSDKTTVCWAKHDYGIKVLEGAVVDEEYFPYICQLDPCEECRAKGGVQPTEGCPACDDWTDERVWPKVNPALRELPTLVDYMRGVVRQAVNQPSMLARVKRLNFCLWTQTHSIWIPFDQWEACKTTTPRPLTGVPCAAAFDMSTKVDLTACVVAQRFDDPKAPTDVVEIEDNEAGQAVKRTIAVNYRIRLTPYAWIPEDTMRERVKNEQIPYDVWARASHLRTTPGPAVDYHEIYDQFVEEIAPRFGPQRVGFDPYNASFLGADLRDKAKFTAVEIKQGRALSEVIKLFYALVRLRRIEHDGNPVFAWCVANAEPKTDRYENVWLEKPAGSHGKRIDLALAAVMAVGQVITLPAPRAKRRRGVAKVWTSAGFQDIETGTDAHA